MPVAHPDLDSVNLIVCERVLAELDSVVSAIRIVDLFWVGEAPPDVPIERTAVKISFLGMARFKLGAPTIKCSFQFKLIRPNGEESLLLDPFELEVGPTVDGTPAAVTHMINVGVVPRVLGLHYAAFIFDGVEIARTSFTLLRPVENPAG